MFDTPLYLFRFEHIQIEIPYANMMIDIYKPWTYIVSFGSCLLYMFLIMIIFPSLTSTLSLKVKNLFAKMHYILLFLYSLFSCISTLYYIIETKEIIHWSNYLCNPIPSWLRIISITFTISKIWEWFDTAVLISKGQSFKKIGFLHIYHHATTFLLFLCVMNFPGGEKSGMLLNGFVHTLMYYHFAFRLPKFLRPMITTLQIIQLMTVTYIWHIVPRLCPKYKHFPNENFLEFLLPYALVPVYSLFFFKFFIEQYLVTSTKKVKSSSKKEE
ncbi:unnamed protein product [Rotaria sp. Silwood2]|nr:unnamed protein product [Rotaria sp. Silwood2]CAF2689038.1 unnamed protein product [Rotaria sp. Silwood2]CAF2934109.1 unnamed protein product [Rotaria sp. Silwood2]CAF3098779.1 unnamed protein product [Rotaria sp. Silwood2]CAF4135416.1 unnamed protein product [Rotaria sp. Silwood2]